MPGPKSPVAPADHHTAKRARHTGQRQGRLCRLRGGRKAGSRLHKSSHQLSRRGHSWCYRQRGLDQSLVARAPTGSGLLTLFLGWQPRPPRPIPRRTRQRRRRRTANLLLGIQRPDPVWNVAADRRLAGPTIVIFTVAIVCALSRHHRSHRAHPHHNGKFFLPKRNVPRPQSAVRSDSQQSPPDRRPQRRRLDSPHDTRREAISSTSGNSPTAEWASPRRRRLRTRPRPRHMIVSQCTRNTARSTCSNTNRIPTRCCRAVNTD